ncbi:ATP-grasp domain-containing protein [Dactylosporangium aurantiacum]|uniref:ATP-grasp domain-containing protein n=1 Tax=Dactylosporangium aurantiacum TaxID=35754 RepID=A0A9Q9IJB7_9ACTN|nr:biotin carboxylase N-terminal domain-containing protein [Dactylosporangium aurantiacum]MDG6100743.1 biotin carboxylase N-terminal domain-containing protein [Dactylosporangium aurantiacum]UWZ55190.1 ATP-grasp domain-containing protein [Dactylosporangium aurantiacum]
MIRRLLVANRGEIARRVFATCRAMGVETVAVYSDADADAPHVAEADYAVHLPGNAPAATYLRGDLIVAAARKCGADAVHPGYGFLSENAEFARAVIDAGLTWVGPSPKAIALMGSKIEAKALLADVGVPMLPTALEPEQVDTFPVLVKASAGGGGRGMRIVRDAESLAEAVAAARREAASAFGDGTVFCERYVERARHIEVQIMADSHGNVVTLGERECSIQRRHQKIVEETPSPAVDPQLRDRLCQAAVAAARAVSYVGAGTVEFLLAPSGEFFFLEMNTRLQVEHPVTECVVGVDLVRLQLVVAEGGPLPFNGPPPLRGHAIEVRLYAEDPAYAWMPSTGTVHRFDVPGVAHAFGPLPAPGLRLDAGVVDGSVVGVHYDPMLAKLVAWAPTRAEAARMLANALARARIHGVTTNRDLLVRVLRHAAFLSGGTDTGFLDRHPEVFAPLLSSVDAVRLSCLAAALSGAARRAKTATLPGLPSGWRNVPSALQTVVYEGPTGTIEVGYRLDRSNDLAAWAVRRIDPDDIGLPGAALDPAGAPDHPPARIVSATGDQVVLDVAGVRLQFAVHEVGGVSFVDSSEGSVTLTELPRYPLPVAEQPEGSLIAPLPGAVGRVLVVPGQRVAAGELLLTVEAMKLEHPVHAPTDGVISDLRVAAGSQVESGALLAVLTPA